MYESNAKQSGNFIVSPNGPLHGAIDAGGAKNSVLKLMTACLLAEGTHVLQNVPYIQDVVIMSDLLEAIGAKAYRRGHTATGLGPEKDIHTDPTAATPDDDLIIETPATILPEAPYELVEKIRASIVVLAPLTSRTGRARLPLPGGDDFGERPVDMHIDSLSLMGVQFKSTHGSVRSGVVRSGVGGTVHSATRVAAMHAATMSTFRPAFIAASAFAALAGIIAIWIGEKRYPGVAGGTGGTGGTGVAGGTGGATSAMGVAETVGDGGAGAGAAAGTGYIDDAASTSNNVAGNNSTGGKRKVRFPYRSRSLLYRLWGTNTVNGFAIGMFGPFVAYWFYRRFGVGAGEVGVLFAVINFVTAFSSLSAAGLAHRYGLVRTMTVVRLIQAVLLIPMVLVSSFELAGAIYLIRMVVQRIAMPLRQSYVLAMAHPEERASLAALSNVPSQFAMAASPTLAGYIFDNISLSLPFELTAFLQLINAGMFWGFFHNMPPPEEESVTLTVQEE